MFIYFAEYPKSAEDLERAKRRDIFANLLLKRSADTLNAILERPVGLLDLELTGCTSIAEYEDVIKIILAHKEGGGNLAKCACAPTQTKLPPDKDSAIKILSGLLSYLEKATVNRSAVTESVLAAINSLNG